MSNQPLQLAGIWKEEFGYVKRITQSILKEINPAYSLEGLMLKPKLQYSGQLLQRADSPKDPDAGKD